MSTQLENANGYVRTEMLPEQAPPSGTVGPRKWVWDNLLSSMLNFSSVGSTISSVLMMVLTLGTVYVAYLSLAVLFQFSVTDAIFSGTDGSFCRADDNRGKVPAGTNIGACWPFVTNRFGQFMNGFYPEAERWRIYLTYLIGAPLIAGLLMPSMPKKSLNAVLLFLVFPIVATILLSGGNMNIGATTWYFWAGIFIAAAVAVFILSMVVKQPEILKSGLKAIVVSAVVIFGILFVLSFDFGLEYVETSKWGGLMLTLVIGLVGIVVSLPLGIMLALGRRSQMPVVRLASTIFIEVWRGVPLITVLFMSSVMLPLFFPEGVSFDKLIRALIVVALFASAYMAEVVRGGLQAIPKGQYEGAQALGLSFWQTNNLITMPQALKMVIPGIVNTFIGLFKDTSLVSIIGLFDFLGINESARQDTNWLAPSIQMTSFVFLAVVYWLFCYAMSRYSLYTEKRLHTGHER